MPRDKLTPTQLFPRLPFYQPLAFSAPHRVWWYPEATVPAPRAAEERPRNAWWICDTPDAPTSLGSRLTVVEASGAEIVEAFLESLLARADVLLALDGVWLSDEAARERSLELLKQLHAPPPVPAPGGVRVSWPAPRCLAPRAPLADR